MALRLLIAILILAVPAEISGCGPFEPEPLFTTTLGPVNPDQFARGELGILQPGYERFYQVIAYRHLSGVPLNDAELRAILSPGPERLASMPSPGRVENPNPWLAARNKAPGIKRIDYIDPNRVVNDSGHFEIFENCHDDAFRTAAATLGELIGKFGATDPVIADWIAAQDTVFSNCSPNVWTKKPEPFIPQPAADPRLHPYSVYQIAAAKFYSRQYDEARQDFQAIARDQASPWHDLAPYLAARCLIRAGKLEEAEGELQRIAGDGELSRWHAAAQGLLTYVRVQLHPQQRMHEAALALVRARSEATISRDLTDYRFLFDKNIKPEPGDDLTDWIISFQAGGAGALETWRAKRTLPWLVAALQSCKPKDQATPELLAAARTVKPDSAAYVTVGFDMVRLLPEAEARAKADELLKATIPLDARNQLRAERMRLAQTFDDFLRFAPRRPVAEQALTIEPPREPREYLDNDSTIILNRDVPLSKLKEASASDLLPQHVRDELRRVISARTVLLSASPRFDDVFALLKSPGSRPFVSPGYGRSTKELDKIDNLRDNWWCTFTPDRSRDSNFWNQTPNYPGSASEHVFVSPAERVQADAEWAKLRSLGTAPNWLGSLTISFAQAHPQDSRVPEALHLVVRATRYGCTDAETGDISHRAFDLLHRRYPNSEWTKQTPYWFN